ncbi:MAG: hypothetical protein CM1200mP26_29710 [Acidimicrobiales bacterium]|nr:MAG: hypothetical protein CM1200mP26_29710 [Acidimicrobiales bacterium]
MAAAEALAAKGVGRVLVPSFPFLAEQRGATRRLRGASSRPAGRPVALLAELQQARLYPDGVHASGTTSRESTGDRHDARPPLSRGREFGPAFGLGGRGGFTTRSKPSFARRSARQPQHVAPGAGAGGFFAVVLLGSDEPATERASEQDLTATVQGAMVQAGLPTVEVQVVDWTVILEGERGATAELKEAAGRVAFAQAESSPSEPARSCRRRWTIWFPRPPRFPTYQPPGRSGPAGPPERGGRPSSHPVRERRRPHHARVGTHLGPPGRLPGVRVGHPGPDHWPTDSDERNPGDNLYLSAVRAEAGAHPVAGPRGRARPVGHPRHGSRRSHCRQPDQIGQSGQPAASNSSCSGPAKRASHHLPTRASPIRTPTRRENDGDRSARVAVSGRRPGTQRGGLA